MWVFFIRKKHKILLRWVQLSGPGMFHKVAKTSWPFLSPLANQNKPTVLLHTKMLNRSVLKMSLKVILSHLKNISCRCTGQYWKDLKPWRTPFVICEITRDQINIYIAFISHRKMINDWKSCMKVSFYNIGTELYFVYIFPLSK